MEYLENIDSIIDLMNNSKEINFYENEEDISIYHVSITGVSLRYFFKDDIKNYENIRKRVFTNLSQNHNIEVFTYITYDSDNYDCYVGCCDQVRIIIVNDIKGINKNLKKEYLNKVFYFCNLCSNTVHYTHECFVREN